MQAQVPPPGIEWTTEDFYPFNPPFPAQAQVPQTKDESNEDWWYNHKNVYIGGQHVGYIAVGYTSFSNYFYNEDATGCALTLPFPLNQTSDCISDDYPITGISPAYTGRSAFQYISHKDLFGHNIWTKVVNQNWFQNVIQTSDGGFLAVGITGSSREPYYDSGSQPAALVVNPGISQFDLNCSSPTDKSIWHINAVKFDINGNIVWNRLYATDLNKFYGAYDICEYVDANSQPAYRIVGAIAQLPQVIGISDNKYPLNAFVVDIHENGDVNWMQEYAATNQGAPYGRDLYGIEAIGTGANQVIVAVGRDAGIGSGTDVNMMAWLGASLTYTTPIQLTENLTSINDAAYDVVFRNDGTFLVGVTSNSNDFGLAGGFIGDGNKAEGAVRSYTVIGTTITNMNDYALTDNTPANQLYAYDLKVGICNTADGGFAAVSTKRPVHYNNMPWGVQSWSCNGGSTITSAYLYGDYWNTDAFVKKFDINGTPQWEKTFDENSTEQPEFYPGNLKNKNVCME
nr:hypothetical protein [Bacteroidota bacterium]